MDRVAYIRSEEKKYHDYCYGNYTLFEPGSWLHKPVQSVMDILEEFSERQGISVLDLGCGNGRNSIPIAQTLKSRSSRIVCVDLLESAIDKLQAYSKEYEVHPFIEAIVSDIEHFNIEKAEYDVIVAVSALEHVSSEEALQKKLGEMVEGTRTSGINCIVVNSNIKEIMRDSNTAVDPMFEVNMTTEHMLELLDQQYEGWDILRRIVKPLAFDIERNGHPVKLTSNCITYVAKLSPNHGVI